MKRRAAIVVLLTVTGALSVLDAAAADLRWVGLFNSELVDWLENENRLDELCLKKEVNRRQECIERALKPKSIKLEIFESAEAGSRLGHLEISATPGKGLKANVVKDGTSGVDLMPDLLDVDWGYGPYFHQTVIESSGTRALIPLGPSISKGWIDTKELDASPDYLSVEEGQIYTLGQQSVIVLSTTAGGIRVREEQAADMWCAAEAAPPLERRPDWMIESRRLFDDNGHLKLKIKYMRGC